MQTAVFVALLSIFGQVSLRGSMEDNGSAVPQQSKTKAKISSSADCKWDASLSALGYPNDDPNLQLIQDLGTFDSVVFLSEKVLVADFLTRRSPTMLQKRNDPNRETPYHLHAVFLDATSGNVLKTLDWPLESAESGIFSTGDGGFLFFSTSRLVRYSADLVPVKVLDFPQLNVPNTDYSGFAIAPSGKSILMQIRENTSLKCLRIDADSLNSVESACDLPEGFAISDRETTASVAADPKSTRSQVVIAGAKEQWHTLCDSSKVVGCRFSQFLDDKTFIVHDQIGMSVLQEDGQVILHQRYGFTDAWMSPMAGPIHGSGNGKRFAVVLNHLPPIIGANLNGAIVVSGTYSFSLELPRIPGPSPARVDVYDLNERSWVFTLAEKNKQMNKIFGMALSPDGTQMAIDFGGSINLYGLPPIKEATHGK